MTPEVKRKHFKVFGAVQGVGYRFFVRDIAQSLNITGWVKNMPDGSVETQAQGELKDISQFEDKLKNGNSMARVEKINSMDTPVKKEKAGFSILF